MDLGCPWLDRHSFISEDPFFVYVYFLCINIILASLLTHDVSLVH